MMAATMFLDIDDVLNVARPEAAFELLRFLQAGESFDAPQVSQLFTAQARQAIAQVHEQLGGNLRFAISSSWRLHFSREQLQTIFELAGLKVVAKSLHDGAAWRCPANLVPAAPYQAWSSPTRAEEIDHWLRLHHAGEPFAAIDDMESGWSLAPSQLRADHRLTGRVILCRPGVGLTAGHVSEIVDALRRPIGRVT